DLAVKVIYDRDRFEPADVDALLRHYARLLESLVARPEARLADVSMLTPDERAIALPAAPPDVLDAIGIIHLPIERQAMERASAIAVTDGREDLSCGSLHAQSNRLARALRSRGVGVETRVAVCCSRRPHLLTALVGVLKSGGAYVPIDPQYPEERRRWLLENARVDV